MKLTKQESATKASLLQRLKVAQAKLETALAVFNSSKDTALVALNAEVQVYNSVLEEVRNFVDETASSIEESFSTKSTHWQESEKGVAVEVLRDEWQDFSADDLDEFELDDLELDTPHADDLEALSEES